MDPRRTKREVKRIIEEVNSIVSNLDLVVMKRTTGMHASQPANQSALCEAWIIVCKQQRNKLQFQFFRKYCILVGLTSCWCCCTQDSALLALTHLFTCSASNVGTWKVSGTRHLTPNIDSVSLALCTVHRAQKTSNKVTRCMACFNRQPCYVSVQKREKKKKLKKRETRGKNSKKKLRSEERFLKINIQGVNACKISACPHV